MQVLGPAHPLAVDQLVVAVEQFVGTAVAGGRRTSALATAVMKRRRRHGDAGLVDECDDGVQ